MDRFTRLCIDVADTGEVLGAFYARYEDHHLTALGTARLTPDAGMHQALEDARYFAEADLGVQLLLWP